MWHKEYDVDIKTMSNEELKQVARDINKHLVVIFRNQSLTPEDELRIARVMGNVKANKGESTTAKDNLSLIPGVMRVTGELNDRGEPGLFGHEIELDWHTHHPTEKNRWPFVWLYSERGSKGSRTSWINQVLAYNDLPEDIKQKVNGITVACGHKVGNFSPSEIFQNNVVYSNPQKIVRTNIENLTGLYFPFLQIFDVIDGATKEEWPELFEYLKNHILQEKYIMHHDWEDGDIVISEQWLSIHKRWTFADMKTRVLHRIALDYEHSYI
jgi:alpha-ketoglutarate-dependent taurine dioxygenase